MAMIILAGGSGSRVHRDVNKVYLPIGDTEMLAYSIKTADRSPVIDQIVLVIRPEDRTIAMAMLADMSLTTPLSIVEGGPSRHESELAGVEHLAKAIDSGEISVAAIHDGARPFMTLDLVERVVATAQSDGGAIPGLAVDQPLFRRGNAGVSVLDSTTLRRVQTPQAFRARQLLDAFRRSSTDLVGGVDTAETIERHSDLDVTVVEGDIRNLKVTFVEDFFEAEAYTASWENGKWT